MKSIGWILALLCSVALAQAPVPAPAVSTALRPQMSPELAARHRVADYLAQGAAPWLPPDYNEGLLWKPDFVVAADGSGTHTSVQAALDAVPAASNKVKRYYIQIKPGVYTERPCAAGKAPITLYGDVLHPDKVLIVESRYNAQPKRAGIDAAHPCHADLAASTHGTPGSATMVIASDDFHAAHISIANHSMQVVKAGVGYPPGAGESGGAQGVALITQADRVLLDNVHLLGHQDTFMARRAPGASSSTSARVLVRHSVIAGDVDFIFGNATLVIDDSSIVSRTGRRTPGNGGHVLAPSTAHDQVLGMLVQRTRFVAEPGVAQHSISLGRAWDEGVARGAWASTASPNGQALVRDSAIGPHIGPQLSPWSASTSRRPYSAEGPQANRMMEFNNHALPADLAREVLRPNDGWAAAEGGTQGGAAASADNVFDVHNRSELVAALAGKKRPRIVRLHGHIDLSVDAQGQPLGAAQYRDPAFTWEAFVKAFDPETWGRKDPEGPLEDARKRSAHRQAEVVVIRVPADTTLVGVGRDAHLVNGSLMLEKVDNIIIRNIHFSDAYDHFPAWEPRDNEHGEWNSEYDNITLRGATHVWIDHCTFDDGERPDAGEPKLLGRRLQRHDGLVDITKQSNFVTVSWNQFLRHDKTTLVGSGDGQVLDEGTLKVSFHHNRWQDTKERAPRVRYGQVHAYNNLHLTTDISRQGYSLGVGFKSRVFSQANVWVTPPEVPSSRLTKLWRGSAFFDRDSLHNGQPVDLLGALRAANPGAQISGDVGWVPTYVLTIDPSSEVASRVLGGAGAGRGVVH